MMRRCMIYSCRYRAGSPCCEDCVSKARCVDRCLNHPDRCNVSQGEERPKRQPPKHKNAPVTHEEVDEAVQLYRAGVPTPEIAQQIGLAKSTVRYMLQDAGIALRRVHKTKYDYTEILRLHEQGLSGKEIADQMGCSQGTVTLALQKGVKERG